MWKIIIADDEQVIRNGLKKLLDWQLLDSEIVGEAADGDALYEEIIKKDPDIVITDIKMPNQTGLDVIKKLYTSKVCPKFIFVSGYEEFSYAKDAVRYGAVDYLLKPVSKEDLKNAVQKAILQLQDYQTVNIFRQEKDELQQVFQKINDGYAYTEEEIYKRFSNDHISFENSFYVGVCFSMIIDDVLKEKMTYEQMGLLRFGIYNRIVGEMRKNKIGFLIKKEENICNVMAVITNDHKSDYIETILVPLKKKMERDTNVKLCMGVGAPINQINQWKISHKAAKFACELYFFEEKDVLDFRKISRDYKVSFDDFNQLLEDTFQKIAARDMDALNTIELALKAIENIHYGNKYAAINRVLIFTGALLEKLFVVELVTGDFVQKQNEVQEAIRYMTTYRHLCAWLYDYYENLLKCIFANSKNKTAAEIVKVKQYIAENYNKDLSLKELAEVACISQNYFSSLFKKETGENYKSYVTRIRMEEAIKLVLMTDLKTYEISERVGYNNVRRFVDAFKNIYKMSPMDYRKIYRKK